MKPFDTLTLRGRSRRIRRLARNALKAYALDVTQLRQLSNHMNNIYRVDTAQGEKWILRVTLPEGGHTLDHVTAEMDWLRALSSETDLQVPRPLAGRDGKLVVEAAADGVPEKRLVAIFGWVPGRDLAEHLTPTSMASLGELSARLHQHAGSYQPPAGLNLLKFDNVFPFPEPVVVLDPQFISRYTDEQLRLIQTGVASAAAVIERLKASGEPPRIIHGDLHVWNVRYGRAGLAPIDFEDLMWGWQVQDIAVTLYHCLHFENYAELRPAFKAGYCRICAWPEREPGDIDVLIAARAIGLLNFVLLNGDMLEIDLGRYINGVEKRLRSLLEPA